MELDKFIRELRLRNYSPRTIKCYIYHVRQFLRQLQKEPRRTNKADIEEWMLALRRKNHAAVSINLAVNTVKTFLRLLYGRKYAIALPRMKEPQRLPKLLSREEIIAMLDRTMNPKHRLLLAFLYSTGLRLSELRKLRFEDLVPKRAYGLVRGGKGAKDRLFHLSPELLKELSGAGSEACGLIFKGRKGRYSVKSIQMVVRRAAERAGIARRVTPHMLRHSYATHLLEQGVDIRLIQELLGHASLNTTQIYTHVASSSFKGLPNPYDVLTSLEH